MLLIALLLMTTVDRQLGQPPARRLRGPAIVQILLEVHSISSGHSSSRLHFVLTHYDSYRYPDDSLWTRLPVFLAMVADTITTLAVYVLP